MFVCVSVNLSSTKMEETYSTPIIKRLIGELIRGRDSTLKLQNLLRRRILDDGSVSSEDLIMNILGSFSNSLSALSSWGSGELCSAPATTYVSSTCSDARTWESGEPDKKPAPVVKNRRGCYKRRKNIDSRVITADTFEDEYAWRKYGQKKVLDAELPRCYFRCKYKDEGCKALKQVQKLKDGSQMFQVTYFGLHTCQIRPKHTPMFSDSMGLNPFLLKSEDSKSNHSPSSLSTVTNANITPSFEQEHDSNTQIERYISSTSHDQSSISLWKDIIGNLEPYDDDILEDIASIDDLRFD